MNRTNETITVVFLSSLFGIILFLPIYLSILETSKESKEPLPKFEVVDRYKGCDVVRYNTPIPSYFLDCPNKQ
jgi:hypothetical protein